jgi:hypothetical protein
MIEQRYNAFISYRRTEHDTAVAKEIQNSLERFRVPRGIRSSSGKERIDLIFRDQEELSITSNLSRRIEDALKASEYLIVICSPGYKQSVWCLHELETFLELRGPEHVLCVLSEGEPPEVFPDLLRHGNTGSFPEFSECRRYDRPAPQHRYHASLCELRRDEPDQLLHGNRDMPERRTAAKKISGLERALRKH